METDEVCGRPLDAFAFVSHVTMGKKRRGGTEGNPSGRRGGQLPLHRGAEGEERVCRLLFI